MHHCGFVLQKWNGAKSGTVKRVRIRAAQFVQDENAVARPGAISSNGEMPLLARTHFLQTAKRRSLPRRIFH